MQPKRANKTAAIMIKIPSFMMIFAPIFLISTL
jgi:hypothetical protein